MDKLFKLDSLEEFQSICDNIVIHFFDHEEQSDNLSLNIAKKELRELIFKTCGNFDEYQQCLLDMGYDEIRVHFLVSALQKKKIELLYLLLLDQNSKHGETVANFDWALKLVCGTSELKTLRYPILQLAFTTFVTSSGQTERLYDIDKNMLAKLIELLENIN